MTATYRDRTPAHRGDTIRDVSGVTWIVMFVYDAASGYAGKVDATASGRAATFDPGKCELLAYGYGTPRERPRLKVVGG
jgi:hypothetical protein